MDPIETAKGYDQIAQIWISQEFDQQNGIAQHQRALAFRPDSGHALDVGCGANGRLRALMQAHDYQVEGVDLSERMLSIARDQQPEITFYHADIITWEPPKQYDFISAWDSIWHVPLAEHADVLNKLFSQLTPNGVCIFSMGGLDAAGEKEDASMGPNMGYSTLGISQTLDVIHQNQCVCRHLEFDQYPEPHLYIIVQRLSE
jgi:2-polyprenyl-3-methyl-5-hydroxy-6-metoxy-1,4-benzoquinol methylase